MASQRTVITSITSELPTCNPNLMPFHIGYTGPAAVSAFMRMEKATPEDPLAILGNETPSLEPSVVVMEADEVTKINELKIELNGNEPNANATSTDIKMEIDTTHTSGNLSESMPETPYVQPKLDLPSPPLSASSSENKTLAESLSTESTLAVSNTSTSLSSQTPRSQSHALPPSALEDADRRFVSTFRGRTIHGLTVDVPAGYIGLVLQSSGEGKVKSGFEGAGEANEDQPKEKNAQSKTKERKHAEGKKPRGRLTRSAAASTSKRAEVLTIEDDDEEMADPTPTEPLPSNASGRNVKDAADPVDEAAESIDDESIKKLVPSSTFSSFTLWHADRAVDAGRDEYYRTLTEWIALSHEIHRTDF
ncbi:ribonuclease H2, subunit C [Crassisporium funariophilum]|nr:ribonuclease H2, subunit C [Crassisporium funariophilum]